MKKLFLFCACVLCFLPFGVSAAMNINAGKFFIQVESNGETWYVNPTNNQRYFIHKNFGWSTLNDLAVTIKDSDLQKLPVSITNRHSDILPSYLSIPDGDRDLIPDQMESAIKTDPVNADTDGDGYTDGNEITNGYDPLQGGGRRMTLDRKVAIKYQGKIVKDSQGFIWYVNPVDWKRYLISNSETALDLARAYGSGITNKSLMKIRVHPLPVVSNSPAATVPAVTDCGIATGYVYPTCWAQAYAACTPAKIISNINFLGAEIGYQYEILGKDGDKCSIRSHYTTSPSPIYEGKDLTCRYDNTKKFLDASVNIFETPDECSGTLKPLFIGNGSTPVAHTTCTEQPDGTVECTSQSPEINLNIP